MALVSKRYTPEQHLTTGNKEIIKINITRTFINELGDKKFVYFKEQVKKYLKVISKDLCEENDCNIAFFFLDDEGILIIICNTYFEIISLLESENLLKKNEIQTGGGYEGLLILLLLLSLIIFNQGFQDVNRYMSRPLNSKLTTQSRSLIEPDLPVNQIVTGVDEILINRTTRERSLIDLATKVNFDNVFYQGIHSFGIQLLLEKPVSFIKATFPEIAEDKLKISLSLLDFFIKLGLINIKSSPILKAYTIAGAASSLCKLLKAIFKKLPLEESQQFVVEQITGELDKYIINPVDKISFVNNIFKIIVNFKIILSCYIMVGLLDAINRIKGGKKTKKRRIKRRKRKTKKY